MTAVPAFGSDSDKPGQSVILAGPDTGVGSGSVVPEEEIAVRHYSDEALLAAIRLGRRGRTASWLSYPAYGLLGLSHGVAQSYTPLGWVDQGRAPPEDSTKFQKAAQTGPLDPIQRRRVHDSPVNLDKHLGGRGTINP